MDCIMRYVFSLSVFKQMDARPLSLIILHIHTRAPATFAPDHASSFRRTAPWGARSFPNLQARGGGGKRMLCASCKLATTHASV
jgi:hypothetical protein